MVWQGDLNRGPQNCKQVSRPQHHTGSSPPLFYFSLVFFSFFLSFFLSLFSPYKTPFPTFNPAFISPHSKPLSTGVTKKKLTKCPPPPGLEPSTSGVTGQNPNPYTMTRLVSSVQFLVTLNICLLSKSHMS